MSTGEAGRLLVADSERSSDMLYALGLFVPDPVIWCRFGGAELAFVGPLEYGRIKGQARPGLTVLSLEQARKRYRARDTRPDSLIAALSRARGIDSWRVPAGFPYGLAVKLRRRRIRLRVADGPFFPERECKTAPEIERIRAGVALAEHGLEVALSVLAAAHIDGGGLTWEEAPLTCERLRGEIDAAISRRGGVAAHTIVAAGVQGADPHHAGAGPIRAHQPVVIDIFPRVTATGYFGDLTRTVVKGRAQPIVQRAFAAVREARDRAKEQIRPGISGQEIHERAAGCLVAAGFETDLDGDPPRGFVHGTGHGLGLDIHEAPRLSRAAGNLRPGHVVTVEPGLYYREWGGMRLEDVVAVREDGCEDLTSAETFLEIA